MTPQIGQPPPEFDLKDQHGQAVKLSDFRAKKFVGAFSRTARRINRTMESPPTFAAAFVKDGDLWKFDETAMLPDLDKEIVQGAKDEQVSVRDFIALQTSQQDDPKQALKIWEPMKK